MGSTGISLAVIGKSKGYNVHIVMPDDTAREKYELLIAMGAVVERVRPVSIIHQNHFVNVAKRRADELNEQSMRTNSPARGYFCNQFENLANFEAHFRTTGPEILRQCGDCIDAFVMGAGTGGTLAGVARYLKPKLPNLMVVLADPQGSGLFHRVLHGILYSPTESEGTRKRHQVDTIIEGIGINRITANFEKGRIWIDTAIKVTDQEAVNMSRFLMDQEGLFLGSSSAVNCVAAVKIARQLGPGKKILTILCDEGNRHLGKFWNDNGAVILGTLVLISSFPPMFGYGTLLTLCGFTYGFPLGLIPAYIGGWAGAMLCFLAARKLLSGYKQRIADNFSQLQSVIDKGGLKLLILIRLAPYPWGIMNVVFAASSVDITTYIIATSVALIKACLHVYIGSTVKSLAEESGTSSPLRIGILVVSMILGLGVFVYISFLVRNAVNVEIGEDGEEEVILRQSGDRHSRDESFDSELDEHGDGLV
ncbi:hypothetical protein SmJEL517_g05633 [Synchytrium microbalum]|uniref:cysteine synthase n=1 Tax=Synchytrium microbalum TaxID=1806994 RepID=A0A507BYU8_9FUNG|nr:uncharacterized protein SmJEL517_g05633 [Synchytrium microbalum]TPX30916.1 hypothetical protein SmJEL517_g05633 [Synchytrium microbalum]